MHCGVLIPGPVQARASVCPPAFPTSARPAPVRPSCAPAPSPQAHTCVPPTGLYDNLAKYELPTPTAVFDLAFFEENPKPFFHLARELYPGNFLPTPTHYFLKLLAEKGILRRVFTQNIDTLERVAGLPPSALVECHGSFSSATCRVCGKAYGQEYVRDSIFGAREGGGGSVEGVAVPRCDVDGCGGVVKPDIVFFGVRGPLFAFAVVVCVRVRVTVYRVRLSL